MKMITPSLLLLVRALRMGSLLGVGRTFRGVNTGVNPNRLKMCNGGIDGNWKDLSPVGVAIPSRRSLLGPLGFWANRLALPQSGACAAAPSAAAAAMSRRAAMSAASAARGLFKAPLGAAGYVN